MIYESENAVVILFYFHKQPKALLKFAENMLYPKGKN